MNDRITSLSELIRENYEKAKKITNDKLITESLIKDSLNEITQIVGDTIEFIIDEQVDSNGDSTTFIKARNKESGYSELIITYEFDPEKIFPLMMHYQNIIHQTCQEVNDALNFLKRVVSDKTFMIKIIRISEMKELPFEDDIPF